MKKTTKKSAAKASRKRALKNLDVKPAKSGTVRGGDKAVRGDKEKVTPNEFTITKYIDSSTP